MADVPPYDTLVRLDIATERLCEAAAELREVADETRYAVDESTAHWLIPAGADPDDCARAWADFDTAVALRSVTD
jgi:hypothetical protein